MVRAQAVVALVVVDAQPHAAECGQRFADPVRAEKMEMRHVKASAPQQTRQIDQVRRRPLGLGERHHLDALFGQSTFENTASVHRSDGPLEPRAVAETREVEQRGLPATQVEAVDDMEDFDHAASNPRK